MKTTTTARQEAWQERLRELLPWAERRRAELFAQKAEEKAVMKKPGQMTLWEEP